MKSNWSIVEKISKKERELRIVVVGNLATVLGFNIWNCLGLSGCHLLMADGRVLFL